MQSFANTLAVEAPTDVMKEGVNHQKVVRRNVHIMLAIQLGGFRELDGG